MAVLRQAFIDAKKRLGRLGLRLIHFSVQKRHVHLIVEVESTRALSRGIQGLCISIAKRLNKRLGRKGTVFGDRFHSHVLTTPSEVYFALKYVLLNARRHGVRDGVRTWRDKRWMDPCTSGEYFDGWVDCPPRPPPNPEDWVVVKPESWLLRGGWRERGVGRPVRLDEIPGVVHVTGHRRRR
jgi:hypothetical protein